MGSSLGFSSEVEQVWRSKWILVVVEVVVGVLVVAAAALWAADTLFWRRTSDIQVSPILSLRHLRPNLS